LRLSACGTFTGAANFSMSSPDKFSIATPEPRDSLRVVVKVAVTRGVRILRGGADSTKGI